METGYTKKQKILLTLWGGIIVWVVIMALRSGNWQTADRSSAGLAPLPAVEKEAVVQVYAARTYSWRGAFAVHTWIAVKPQNAEKYTIYQVIGWYLRRGIPAVSISNDVPDRKWYGSQPWLVGELRGEKAQKAIPEIEKVVADYPYAREYRAWPGPNSNTFVSYVIRQVPQMEFDLPPLAIGKDWLVGNKFLATSESKSGIQLSLFGVLGITLGWYEGIEINILGLNFGIDIRHPAVKLPLVGRIGFAKV